jgi:carbon monoxide dehydrogenase subunit G
MEVTLDKRYPMPASPAQVWAVLADVRAVAGCMPGAAITEQVDDTHFKGAVKVKVGPATAAFAGDIEVKAVDAAAQRMQLLGKGADRSGSTAAMDLTATIEPGDTPGDCVLVGKAVVTVNGKFAQFGGRMMVQVSDMILAQFADNFRIAAAAVPVVAEAAPAAAAVHADDAAADVGGAVAAAVASAAAPAGVAAAVAAPSAARPVSAVPAAKPHTELNGLAIAWMLVKSWFAGLFGRRA